MLGHMNMDKLEFLMMLVPGDVIEAYDQRTGQRWHGPVDITIPEQGKLWMFAELGERKLIDAEVHLIHRDTGDKQAIPGS